MGDRLSTNYINSVLYKDNEDKLKQLKTVLDDLSDKLEISRKLRYDDVDIEAERASGRLQPDELFIPQHIIDTNIRREQSAYVQYITQSPRALICEDEDDPTVDLALLERDLTKKVRYDGWQPPLFSNIDGFEANGYSVMEVVMDQGNAGEVGHEVVPLSDFAFLSDTRDIQSVEMTARTYYYTRTKLLQLCGDPNSPKDSDWNRVEVEKVLSKDPESISIESLDPYDKSLYRVIKNMFRVGGIVHVAWAVPDTCSDWVRKPRPLYLGRRQLAQEDQSQQQNGMLGKLKQMITGQQKPQLPPSKEQYEVNYPYIIFPYLISENDTISQLKGRVFLDQDLQEAVSSLVSSTVTQARRASGLYFSKDVSDPNDDLLLQKNIFFKPGCIINSKVTQFQLTAPDPSMFSAIQMLVSANQNETSQVNFAVNNRKDSRKTAKEVETSEQQQQQLSTVQVVLFAIALTQMYRLMVDIIKSRVVTGLIQVNQAVRPLYDKKFKIKPSGDTDVIEKQALVKNMMQAWPTIQQTAAAPLFMCDLLELMFPDRAAKYIQAIQAQIQQQQSAQAQQQQQLTNVFMQMGKGLQKLAKSPEMFSDTGRIHALPAVEHASDMVEQVEQQMQQQPNNNGGKK